MDCGATAAANHRSPGRHVDGGSLAEIFVRLSAIKNEPSADTLRRSHRPAGW
jgi:hypothetical protein